jgi:RNA polymerase sigma factor (TIGR02999 family)
MERGPDSVPAGASDRPATGEITRLVRRWSEGDARAFDHLIELVYDDLRRIAHHHLVVGARDGLVDTTGLVHEAYLKLARVEGGSWESRGQFFAFCSKAMRRILIDFARRRTAGKRGGASVRVPLTEETAVVDAEAARILDVEEALQQLERRDERMARIIECRFFGGMSVPDTAEALGTSTRTVEREWARARAYLYQALRPDVGFEGGAGSAS